MMRSQCKWTPGWLQKLCYCDNLRSVIGTSHVSSAVTFQIQSIGAILVQYEQCCSLIPDFYAEFCCPVVLSLSLSPSLSICDSLYVCEKLRVFIALFTLAVQCLHLMSHRISHKCNFH